MQTDILIVIVHNMYSHLFYISINVESRQFKLNGIQSFQFDVKHHIITISHSFYMNDTLLQISTDSCFASST